MEITTIRIPVDAKITGAINWACTCGRPIMIDLDAADTMELESAIEDNRLCCSCQRTSDMFEAAEMAADARRHDDFLRKGGDL